MRAKNFKDLSGQRFGRLTATTFDGTRKGKSWWRCSCDCGAEKIVAYQHLARGLVKSCGCLRKERTRATMTKHGGSADGGARWYQAWSGMLGRCNNSNSARFHRYGGRGIRVCDRWRDPLAFYADMGDPPEGHSLDRIDNDRDYSPDNCRWATAKEQNNNRCTTRMISFGGETMSAAVWAQRLGIGKATMYYRLREWPLERALTEPPRRW